MSLTHSGFEAGEPWDTARTRFGPGWRAFLLGVLLPLASWASPDFAPSFLAFGVVAGLLAGSIEELGWTGFATPRLLARFSPLRAGLMLGLAWAAWHGLADYAGNAATMGTGDWLIRMIVYWIIPLTGYRVLMTWSYAHHPAALHSTS